MSKIAIIDIGTNTFHLMVVDLATNNKILHKEKIAVRLGMNGISKNTLASDAQQRAIKTLKQFKQTAEELAVESIRATATSAVRNAGNGQQFVDEVKEATGIEINVISGLQEAEYIYKGIKQALSIGSETTLVMDIGGGSVEFIICDGDTIYWLESFEIGAQRLLDQFQNHDPIASDDIQKLKDYLFTSLTSLQQQLIKYKPKQLIGSSGTFDTLVDIAYAEKNIEKPDETYYELPIIDFKGIFKELIEKTRDQRLAIPGMLEMRVDMIVVASCLIDYILTMNSFQTINVSTYSLKEGILSDVIAQA